MPPRPLILRESRHARLRRRTPLRPPAALALPPGIYPATGSIAIGGGATVSFLDPQPPGARLHVITANPPLLPAGRVSLVSPARLELTGGDFGRGAVLTYPLPAALATQPLSDTAVQLATYDLAKNAWVSVPAIIDPTRRVLTGTVAHFSWWNPQTWDWAGIGAAINQGIGQLAGKRAPAASCSGAANPLWVRGVAGVDNGNGLAVRGCTEGSKGDLVVRLVNNRPYGQKLTYSRPVASGEHDPGVSLLDQAENRLGDALVGGGGLYLPPAGEATVTIPQPSGSGGLQHAPWRIGVDKGTLFVDVLRVVASDLIGELAAKAAGELAGHCGTLMLTDVPAQALKDPGTLIEQIRGALDGVKTALPELVADGALGGVSVGRLQDTFTFIEKGNLVGNAISYYGIYWNLLDLWVDTGWVAPITPDLGYGFSVLARTSGPSQVTPGALTVADLLAAARTALGAPGPGGPTVESCPDPGVITAGTVVACPVNAHGQAAGSYIAVHVLDPSRKDGLEVRQFVGADSCSSPPWVLKAMDSVGYICAPDPGASAGSSPSPLSSPDLHACGAVYGGCFPVRSLGGAVNVHDDARVSAPVLRTIPSGQLINVLCVGEGETVQGPNGSTDIWDEVSPGRWISDAYVRAEGRAGDCH